MNCELCKNFDECRFRDEGQVEPHCNFFIRKLENPTPQNPKGQDEADCSATDSDLYFIERERLAKEKTWYRRALYLACGDNKEMVRFYLSQTEE